jgi:hypothetical protein
MPTSVFGGFGWYSAISKLIISPQKLFDNLLYSWYPSGKMYHTILSKSAVRLPAISRIENIKRQERQVKTDDKNRIVVCAQRRNCPASRARIV